MNAVALKRLKKVVLDVPKEKFRIAAYTTVLKDSLAHCAIGLARLDPWRVENTEISEYMTVDEKGHARSRLRDTFGGMAKIYGLDDAKTFLLFGDHGDDPTRDDFAENVDQLLRGDKMIRGKRPSRPREQEGAPSCSR